jgi:hypothetical protein
MKAHVATEIILLAGLALLAYVCLMQQRQLTGLEDLAWKLEGRIMPPADNGTDPANPKPRTARKPKPAMEDPAT